MAENKTEAKPKETAVKPEMQEAAQAQLKEQAKKRAARDKPGGPRLRGRGIRDTDIWIDETISLPAGFDTDNLSPTSYMTLPHGEITGLTDTQEFTVVEERLKGLTFTRPGMALPKKRQYTVKALHKDGRLVQVPFEPQINNSAAGSMEDAIGLRRMMHKGMMLFIDFENMMPVYCAAYNCWAAAHRPELSDRFPENANASGTGFCSMRHAEHTMPNRYKEAQNVTRGMFGSGATTSVSWTSD